MKGKEQRDREMDKACFDFWRWFVLSVILTACLLLILAGLGTCAVAIVRTSMWLAASVGMGLLATILALVLGFTAKEAWKAGAKIVVLQFVDTFDRYIDYKEMRNGKED